MQVSMTFVLYHLLFATLAALALSGCASTGGGALTPPALPSASAMWPGNWFGSPAAPAPLNAPSADQQGAAKPPAAGGKEDPTTFLARMTKGREAERQGKLDKAREVYEDLLKRYPDRYEPCHRLGVVADRQKRYLEAQDLLEQASRMQPENTEVLGDLGYCYFLQGKLTQAEETTRRATELAPRDNRLRNNLGLILGHQGRMNEALDQFRRCGSEADALYNLAFVHASRNDADAAKACFMRALVVDPTYEKAREALASFEVYENQPEDLKRMTDAMALDERHTVPYVEGGAQGSSGDGAAPIATEGGGQRGATQASHASPSLVMPRQTANARTGMFKQAQSANQFPASSGGE